VGIDLNPVDLNDRENVEWLRALVWPEQQKRVRQLELAVQLARSAPPKVVAGDALDILPTLIDRASEDSQLCVYHSFSLSLAGGQPRERLEVLLAKVSEKRTLFHVSLEWAKNSEFPLLSLALLNAGEKTEKTLARCHAHGEWLEWLGNS